MKKSAGIAPETDIREHTLHLPPQHGQGSPLSLWNPGEASQEIQNKGTSGPKINLFLNYTNLTGVNAKSPLTVVRPVWSVQFRKNFYRTCVRLKTTDTHFSVVVWTRYSSKLAEVELKGRGEDRIGLELTYSQLHELRKRSGTAGRPLIPTNLYSAHGPAEGTPAHSATASTRPRASRPQTAQHNIHRSVLIQIPVFLKISTGLKCTLNLQIPFI